MAIHPIILIFQENVNDENPNFEVQNFSSSSLVHLLTKGEIFVAGSDQKTFDYQQVINEADNMTGYIPVDSTTEILSTNSLESFDVGRDEVTLYKVDKDKKTDKFKVNTDTSRIANDEKFLRCDIEF